MHYWVAKHVHLHWELATVTQKWLYVQNKTSADKGKISTTSLLRLHGSPPWRRLSSCHQSWKWKATEVVDTKFEINMTTKMLGTSALLSSTLNKLITFLYTFQFLTEATPAHRNEAAISIMESNGRSRPPTSWLALLAFTDHISPITGKYLNGLNCLSESWSLWMIYASHKNTTANV